MLQFKNLKFNVSLKIIKIGFTAHFQEESHKALFMLPLCAFNRKNSMKLLRSSFALNLNSLDPQKKISLEKGIPQFLCRENVLSKQDCSFINTAI